MSVTTRVAAAKWGNLLDIVAMHPQAMHSSS